MNQSDTLQYFINPFLISISPSFHSRIRTKIVDPYNKIVARTSQLARLQVFCLFFSFNFTFALSASVISLSLDIPNSILQNCYFFIVLLCKHCAFFPNGLISIFIGSTSEIDTALPSRLFAVRFCNTHWGKKEKCTQTKRKSFWGNRCFCILICDYHIRQK